MLESTIDERKIIRKLFRAESELKMSIGFLSDSLNYPSLWDKQSEIESVSFRIPENNGSFSCQMSADKIPNIALNTEINLKTEKGNIEEECNEKQILVNQIEKFYSLLEDRYKSIFSYKYRKNLDNSKIIEKVFKETGIEYTIRTIQRDCAFIENLFFKVCFKNCRNLIYKYIK